MPLNYESEQDKRAKEISLWLWWNWWKHGGKKPSRETIRKATELAKKNKLGDEELEEIYRRWSTVYLPGKVVE